MVTDLAKRCYKDQDGVVLTSIAPAKSLTKSISMLVVYGLHGIILARNKKVKERGYLALTSASNPPSHQQERDQPRK
eukprot:scaffold155101_cov16-Prasinocladus_malaysianus.AAC.1